MKGIEVIDEKLMSRGGVSEDAYYKAHWALKQVTLYNVGVGLVIDFKKINIGTFDDLNILEDDGEYGNKSY